MKIKIVSLLIAILVLPLIGLAQPPTLPEVPPTPTVPPYPSYNPPSVEPSTTIPNPPQLPPRPPVQPPRITPPSPQLPPLYTKTDGIDRPLPAYADIATVSVWFTSNRLLVVVRPYGPRPQDVTSFLDIYVDKDNNEITGYPYHPFKGADYWIHAVSGQGCAVYKWDAWVGSWVQVPISCNVEWQDHLHYPKITVDAGLPDLGSVIRVKVKYTTDYLYYAQGMANLRSFKVCWPPYQAEDKVKIKCLEISMSRTKAFIKFVLADTILPRDPGTSIFINATIDIQTNVSRFRIYKEYSQTDEKVFEKFYVWLWTGTKWLLTYNEYKENWWPQWREEVPASIENEVPLDKLGIPPYVDALVVVHIHLILDDLDDSTNWITLTNFTLHFKSGWNLFSLPIYMTDSGKVPIIDLFTYNIGKIGLIAYWSPSERRFHYWPNGDLTELEVGKAYWLYATSDFSLTYPGKVPNGSYVPCEGLVTKTWNPIGVIGLQPLNPEQVCNTCHCLYIIGWDNSTAKWEIYVRTLGGGIKELRPGKGYFCYISQV